ncbi:ubiquinol-cytochrome c reductase iron-sulfur subunit [Nocardia seriolae]|uniref:(2Fe-2S)-binding protein n=1 Tax=Nocardia seriolae TaxID=37332 RepID=A0A0B8NK95_9NOCA|nr:Rieske (2Fe-2S) protein [Nocardia seriolae]MTJ64755.1 Rieske 2Fe-2S domain-containing protein [Nocardia seriolae]MTJ74180.1 Rieske 2Fe-2S domain-containing protein [Nocardia seriolae]MTJ89595.1 Rieske 2Fe-2S domain-containing protein [Nocardia seriolae]MTK33569.1 Rieske 2Fe-2S domain-containing protein [Nocardia seriolae]MTK42714.1 Rieske 2Fe-2S domain-containing protein [Nocardia seriolae]
MSGREVRRFVDELLAGKKSTGFSPDEAEAEEMRTAIELRAARLGSDAPSEEFLSGLQRRLAAELDDEPAAVHPIGGPATGYRRRNLLIGTSAAAAAATVGAVVDRTLIGHGQPDAPPAAKQAPLSPNTGAWLAVARSSDLTEGATIAFDVGTVNGFVRRDKGIPVAVSGVCTHQGCKLWLDAPAERLRCPCHSTSFSIEGQVVTHQLPVAPAPLPLVQVRENNGTIEVFAPTEPA